MSDASAEYENRMLWEIKVALDGVRAEIAEIRSLLIGVVAKTAVDPVALVAQVGSAVAHAQGLDRPVAEIQGQPQDIFTDPSMALTHEPANEAQERQEDSDRFQEFLNTRSAWDDAGIEAPPGEFDEGPDGRT